VTVELADTSAWTSRRADPRIEQDFDAAVLAGDIATCSPVQMELLWGARTAADFRSLRGSLAALPSVPVDAAVWERAVEVWQLLVDQGRQRQVKQPDLLVAAAGEVAGVVVCHYDRHFDVIAAVTGQPVRAIAPLGSL
jgi:predicted nucleic acid-binding protein